MRQGIRLSPKEVSRTLQLLETDLSLNEIATRLGISRTTVSSLNRRARIREYAGKRNSWLEKKGA